MQTAFTEFFEDINDALKEVVRQLGGYKKVGPMFKPELPITQAEGWLRDCLNPDRREKLSPEQVVMLLSQAAKAGYHGGMMFITSSCGYEGARHVQPVEQQAALQQAFIEAVGQLQGIQQQLARVQALQVVEGGKR